MADEKEKTPCEKNMEAVLKQNQRGGPLSQAEAVNLMMAGYCFDIIANFPITTVSPDNEQPCTPETKFKSTESTQEFTTSDNAYGIVADIGVNTRFKTAHSSIKPFLIPCPACAGYGNLGWDDDAVKNWKRGKEPTNKNYDACIRNRGQENQYYDICCIQREIFVGNKAKKDPICNVEAHKYGTIREMYKKFAKGVDIGKNPCPGGGEIVFNAEANIRIVIRATYTAYAYYGPNAVKQSNTDTKTVPVFFGGSLKSRSKINAIVEVKKVGTPAGKEGQFTIPGCKKLAKEGRNNGRPCSQGEDLLGASLPSCPDCPWFETKITCGLKFWDCQGSGSLYDDIRCTESGYGLATNTDTDSVGMLTNLSQVMNATISGYDRGKCEKNQIQRKGSLPCEAPKPIVQFAGQAFSLAGHIQRYGWSGAMEAAGEAAKTLAAKGLPDNPCSPIGYDFVSASIEVL